MKGNSNEASCKCKDHEFILRPLSQNLYHSKKVQVCLCQALSKNGRKKISGYRKKCASGFPTFNTDRNYATPAFILESQREHFLKNRNLYRKDHSRKTKQFDQPSSDLYFPTPKSEHEYCNVCCTSYTDYIQHISSFEHHRQIKLTKFNDYIIDLGETYRKKDTQEAPKRSLQERCIEIDDDSDLSSMGYKKLKSQEKTQLTQNIPIISQNALPQLKNHYQFINYIPADRIINFQNPLPQQQYLPENNEAMNLRNLNYPGFSQLNQNQFSYLLQKQYLKQQTLLEQTQKNCMYQASNRYPFCQDVRQMQLQNYNCLQNLVYQANMKQNSFQLGSIQAQSNYFVSFRQVPYFNVNNLSLYAW